MPTRYPVEVLLDISKFRLLVRTAFIFHAVNITNKDMDMQLSAFPVILYENSGFPIGIGFFNKLLRHFQRQIGRIFALWVKFLFAERYNDSPHLIFVPAGSPLPFLGHLIFKRYHVIRQHTHAANEQIPLCVSVVASSVSSRILDSGSSVSCVGNSGICHNVCKFLNLCIKPVHDSIDCFRGKTFAFFHNRLPYVRQLQNANFSFGKLVFQMLKPCLLVVIYADSAKLCPHAGQFSVDVAKQFFYGFALFPVYILHPVKILFPTIIKKTSYNLRCGAAAAFRQIVNFFFLPER